jgi:hypothetical protein
MECLRHQIKNYKESPEKQARHTDKTKEAQTILVNKVPLYI